MARFKREDVRPNFRAPSRNLALAEPRDARWRNAEDSEGYERYGDVELAQPARVLEAQQRAAGQRNSPCG